VLEAGVDPPPDQQDEISSLSSFLYVYAAPGLLPRVYYDGLSSSNIDSNKDCSANEEWRTPEANNGW